MAELADAPDLGSGVFDVQVQVLLSAGLNKKRVAICHPFLVQSGANDLSPAGSRSPLRSGRRKAEVPRTSCGLRSAPVGAKLTSPGRHAPCYPHCSAPVMQSVIRSVLRGLVESPRLFFLVKRGVSGLYLLGARKNNRSNMEVFL